MTLGAMSKAIPFLTVPEKLDGSMVGDMGFDPMGLSDIQTDLRYSNYDNFISDESLSLPGIVGLMDQIQAQTGLHVDESSGWHVAVKDKNDFWADPIVINNESGRHPLTGRNSWLLAQCQLAPGIGICAVTR